ncbi:hypothetical protein [Halalkalibacterium ligniniphilum]|uniref:hypothetical protein n=1 Tax=Halalkalibacterium ligniniphilum TaxID=1134413 RepID=UPI000364CC9E|nr:hypothetical protein [Halalkalibacterium ligniniphilum]
MDDHELSLIQQAKAGDDEAPAKLLQQYYRFVYLYILKLPCIPLLQKTLLRRRWCAALNAFINISRVIQLSCLARCN